MQFPTFLKGFQWSKWKKIKKIKKLEGEYSALVSMQFVIQ